MDIINNKGYDDIVFSNQEQIYDFCEILRNSSNGSIEQFQAILEVFVCDILKYRKETKRLEDSFKREKETNEKYLRRIEEDQERDMHELEEKIRKEERQKFEIERELIQQRTTKEINDLQSNIQRLRTIEQLYINRKSEEDSLIIPLREEIAKLIEENQTFNASLNEALTTNAILQSDLQSFRTQLSERQTMLLQEKQSSSSNYREKESLQINVRHLVEVNKQLRDENDSLRAMIEANKSNTTPAHLTLSPRRLFSTTGSTLGSYWNDSKLGRCPSPSYVTITNQSKFDSFDLESADDKGILINRSLSIKKRDINNSSKPVVPLAPASIICNTTDEKNTMNDSGLSLTTVRDATELESDHESNPNQQTPTTNLKQYRPLITKPNKADTDSDDVFVEVSFDRNHPKKSSQQRPSRRPISNTRSASKPTTNHLQAIVRSPTTKHGDEQNMKENLPFDRMFKVVFCGDAAVGKTTLIMRLCKNKFVSNINSTLGVDFQNKQIEVDGKHVALQLWDTAGQERFRSIAKSYFRRCDGVILVYDSTYERSFLNVREWINTITDSTPKRVSVMIVANKIDLRDQMRAEGKRVIEKIEGLKLAKEYKALFIETSAKDGTNSNEALAELARDMQCNEDLERFRTAGIDLDKTTKKSACCGVKT
ncbi:unnamed protein product [Rotaria sp. Silwood2]|nr:unnamed protein product [Rotaria sp. Silwood2]CAF2581969.1 unnamed protein product [Rotaria sp. Silwood2]CAF3994914.1 unnamed protein product [Rotaria sp. Silwood2]CAF4006930.1 unnamed protein product [Rotaria sp. Silwood2]